MTLLDTNLVSRFLHPEARTKFPTEVAFMQALVDDGAFAISYVTQFELQRGVNDLALRGQGRRRLVDLQKFLSRVEVLGLDGMNGRGWTLAAQFWAKAKNLKPSVILTDADLLIATTAALHQRAFATSEARLVDNLKRIAFPVELRVVAASRSTS